MLKGIKKTKWIGYVANAFFILLMLAFLDGARYQEYEKMVNALSKKETFGKCTLDTKIERNWPFSWGVISFDLYVKAEDGEYLISSSRYTKPDRIITKRFTESYILSDYIGDDQRVFLQIDLDRKKEIEKLSVGLCHEDRENPLEGTLNSCEPKQVQECT